MGFTRDIRLRVTSSQYEIIKTKAKVAGYKTVSAFLRDTVLNIDYSVEKLVKEIYQIIVEDKKKLK